MRGMIYLITNLKAMFFILDPRSGCRQYSLARIALDSLQVPESDRDRRDRASTSCCRSRIFVIGVTHVVDEEE